MACFTPPPPLLSAATRPRRPASSWLGRRPPHPPAAAATTPTPAPAPARLTMGVRAVPSYDGSFELADETRAKLVEQLGDPAFLRQVAANSGAEEAEFLGVLFQPVPYSPGTPRGMPADLSHHLDDPHSVVINVPPPFMFAARCFKPPRLCAIYRRSGISAAALAAFARKAAAPPAAEPATAWEGLGAVIADVADLEGDADPDDDAELDALVV